MKFTVVLASIGRPSLGEALESVKDAEEIIVKKVDIEHRREQVSLINEAVAEAKGDTIFFMGERQVFAPDWKEKTIEAYGKIGNSGVVSYHQNIVIAGCCTRDFMDEYLGGTMWSPDYIHYCPDIEIGDVARKFLKYIEVPRVLVNHYDKDFHSNPYSQGCADFDRETYEMRTRLGWPPTRVRTDEEKAVFNSYEIKG